MMPDNFSLKTGTTGAILPFHELRPEQWNATVEDSGASIHCTYEWLGFISSYYNINNLSCAITDERGISALLPWFRISSLSGTRYSSHIFSSYGEPVFLDPSHEYRKILDDLLMQKNSRIRATYAMADRLEMSAYFYSNELQQFIDLSPFSDMNDYLEGFRGKRRKKIRRHLRSEARISRGRDNVEIDNFYRLQLMTRKNLGLPTPAKRYYGQMLEALAPYSAMIYTLHIKGNPAASVLSYEHLGVFYYAAANTDRRFSAETPMETLIAHLIEECIRRRIHRFDFGGTPYNNDNLFNFKKRWRTTEVEWGYLSRKPLDFGASRLFKTLSTLYGSLPTALAAVTGEPVIRLMK